MTVATCPQCGGPLPHQQEAPSPVAHCPACGNNFILRPGEESPGPAQRREEVLEANQVTGLKSTQNSPQQADPAGSAPPILLDLPSLQKSIETDEGGRRTRAIHRVFFLVVGAVLLLGTPECASRGAPDTLFERLGIGVLLGLLVAWIYATWAMPWSEVTGEEELETRVRRYRKSAKRRSGRRKPAKCPDLAQPSDSTSHTSGRESEGIIPREKDKEGFTP